MSIQEFDKIFHSKSPSSPSVEGRLRFAPQGVGWKSATGDLVTVASDEIGKFQWLRSVKKFQLRVKLVQGKCLKFDGFDRDDHDRVRESIKTNFQQVLDHLELCIKGWNWGSTEIDADQLTFHANNKILFELPYSEIANVNSGKNEAAIEFTGLDSVPRNCDQLVECRLYVPGLAPADSEAQDGDDPEDDAAPGKQSKQQSAADYLCEVIKSKADLGIEKSDMIASFKELAFLTPRGRYDVEMFQDFLRLRGKSYDYKIKYATIKRLFMLPKPDDLHVMFVIGLDPPLRQGQTQYRYLVVQFLRDEELTTELNLDEQVLEKQYNGNLQRTYDGPIYEVVTAIFNGLTGTKILVTGGYKSTSGQPAIKCSYKANEGHLYPMDRQLLFVPKPTTYLSHTEISYITFSRVSGIGSSRTIDMAVTMRGSGPEISLSNIAREEYTNLETYLQRHGIKVKNELVEETARLPYLGIDDDDDDDAGGAAGRSASRGGLPDDLGDEDEDESPDEDFIASSESDVAEEFNSDYESSDDNSSEQVQAEPPKSAAAAKGKKKRPIESEISVGSASKKHRGGDDEDDNDVEL